MDTGGTFWRIERVVVTGFAYGVIFDQTELADVIGCQFSGHRQGCVWLVNGEDHLELGGGVKGGFTNRIGIVNCQLAPGPAGDGVIDVGGYSHSFVGNNFNGGRRFIRLAGADVCLIASTTSAGTAIAFFGMTVSRGETAP